jgi:hypothetical protein
MQGYRDASVMFREFAASSIAMSTEYPAPERGTGDRLGPSVPQHLMRAVTWCRTGLRRAWQRWRDQTALEQRCRCLRGLDGQRLRDIGAPQAFIEAERLRAELQQRQLARLGRLDW